MENVAGEHRILVVDLFPKGLTRRFTYASCAEQVLRAKGGMDDRELGETRKDILRILGNFEDIFQERVAPVKGEAD